MSALPPAPFGRLLTAMVTPFTAAGDLDCDGAAALADHLVKAGCSGLVISGTTGEAPTTTDDEKDRLLTAAVGAVGDRAAIIAGIGSNDTRHSVELAQAAAKAGAHALLAVTPYYSRPPQAGLLAHFRQIADATDLPLMVYDIPVRSGIEIETETLVRLAEHPRIVAVKDAKSSVTSTSWVRARSDLAVYSGDDINTLPWLSLGAVGVVGVTTHVAAARMGAMISSFEAGDIQAATETHLSLLPAFRGLFRNQAVILAKAALNMLGLPAGPARLPLVDATSAERQQLREDLQAAGIDLPDGTSA
jgi:4-hydroxy-tetrahydrodipicolinate synthase